MPSPERPETLITMLRDLRSRVSRIEHRDAFGDRRKAHASSGGGAAQPVWLVDTDARETVLLTASFVDVIAFTPAISGQLTVHASGNGAAGQVEMQLYHPATARVLATSVSLGTQTYLGPCYRASFGWDNTLSKAATLYDATVVLQARYTNVATTRLKLLSARWGATSV